MSTDTLYWDPHSSEAHNSLGSRPTSTKSRHNYQQQQQQQGTGQGQGQTQTQSGQQQFIHRYYPHAAQIQPAPPQGYQQHYVHKPKSWDNLTTKSFGGYGFGYGYLDTVAPKQTSQQPQQQSPSPPIITNVPPTQRHSMPRKNSYTNRYTTYCDVTANYPPPPTQFIHHQITTTMTTTKITAKSTENLIGQSYSDNNISCECLTDTIPPATTIITGGGGGATGVTTSIATIVGDGTENRGYYSNIPRTNGRQQLQQDNVVTSLSEITRL